MPRLAYELIGYAASALIVTSMLMPSLVRLRMFNLAGALAFSLYGFLIGAYPVGLLNLLTASINLVQILRLRRRREIFRILEVRPESEYLRYFLEFQSADIHRFFPHFLFAPDKLGLALFVLRDLVPAGLVLADLKGDTLVIQLDYVVPQYRDLKVGRYLFTDQAEFFRRRGVRRILSPAETQLHAAYLEAVGFTAATEAQMYGLTLQRG